MQVKGTNKIRALEPCSSTSQNVSGSNEKCFSFWWSCSFVNCSANSLMFPSETINIWTFKEGPTPFHFLPLTIYLCFVGLEVQITVLEMYLFSFFASQNNDICLLLPSIHLLVVLENIEWSVARTLFSKKWRTWPNLWRKSVGASNAWGEGRTFVFVRCGFQTCNNFPEAVECSLSGDWKPILHDELALIRLALCCSFNQFLSFLMIRYRGLFR